MSQILSIKHTVEFKPGASFSERESLINTEITKILSTLRSRGFYPLTHDVVNKNDKNASINFTYKV
jgi:hypothetical protein